MSGGLFYDRVAEDLSPLKPSSMAHTEVLILEDIPRLRDVLVNFFTANQLFCRILEPKSAARGAFDVFDELTELLDSKKYGMVVINKEQWGMLGGVDLVTNLRFRKIPFIVLSETNYKAEELGAHAAIHLNISRMWDMEVFGKAVAEIKLPKITKVSN